MSWRATDNLRCYLHEARLPDMHYSPVASSMAESLASSLNVQPKRYRRLEVVHVIDAQLFNDMICDWTEDHIPLASLGVDDEDETSRERFTVPCEPYFSVPCLPLGRVYDIERVSSWIDNFPLESVQRTTHLLFPESKSWRFSCTEGPGQPFFRSFSWSQSLTFGSSKAERRNCSLILFAFAPWTLSEQELQKFVRSQSFPQRQRATAPTHELEHHWPNGLEWLWSKVWDVCFSRDCRWFVISTYTHWVFGVFSEGWTAAVVSPLYRHDSYDPTVLELLLFWMVSAMGYEGGWIAPEDPNLPTFPIQSVCATVMDLSVNATRALALATYQ